MEREWKPELGGCSFYLIMVDLQKLQDVMPNINGNEFKILYYIANGYSYARSIGKDAYEASYSQIRNYTGVKKDDTVLMVLKKLKELGYITQKTEWVSGNCKSTSLFTCSLYIEDGTPKNGVGYSKKWSRGTPKNGVGGTPKNGEIVNKENKIKELNKEELGEINKNFFDNLGSI